MLLIDFENSVRVALESIFSKKSLKKRVLSMKMLLPESIFSIKRGVKLTWAEN